MMMKDGIRILAIDDSTIFSFEENVLVVGVIGRRDMLEGIVSFKVIKDGDDATEKIKKAVKNSRFREQIRIIVLNGTVVAGMNVVDLIKLKKELNIPIMAITRKTPHPDMLKKCITSSEKHDYINKLKILDSNIKSAKINGIRNMYVQSVGINKKDIAKHFENSVRLLRIAHIIANGVARGESKGRF